jgi:hypothetical protein
MTPPTLAWLTTIWERQVKYRADAGRERRDRAAQELALRAVPGWKRILEQQAARTKNPIGRRVCGS